VASHVLQAIERITSAEANLESAVSAAFPQLSVSADHQVSKTNAGDALATRDSDTTNTTTGTAGVSWLIDLFGQYRRAKESDKASLDADYASADVTRLTFLSSVVTAYVDARFYQEGIAIARERVRS
jgi:multidrug efflux system outer membrane protein